MINFGSGSKSTISKGGSEDSDQLFRKGGSEDPDPDRLLSNVDPRIRNRVQINVKMRWIGNAAGNKNSHHPSNMPLARQSSYFDFSKMESVHEGTRLYIVSTPKAMMRGLENAVWETYRNSRKSFDLLVVAGCIDFAQCGGHCMRPVAVQENGSRHMPQANKSMERVQHIVVLNEVSNMARSGKVQCLQ